jgi:hypothetical protein
MAGPAFRKINTACALPENLLGQAAENARTPKREPGRNN